VQLLENLMTTVSELVLTRNQLLQMVRSSEDSEFKAPLQRLSHITTDLQEGVMKTRMQPIGNAWAKLPRIVRSLAHDLNKKIDLEMVGAETELDRQVLELIKDPLTHMVRNSGDHGRDRRNARPRASLRPARSACLTKASHHYSDRGRRQRLTPPAWPQGRERFAIEASLTACRSSRSYHLPAGFSTAQQASAYRRGVGTDSTNHRRKIATNDPQPGGEADFDRDPVIASFRADREAAASPPPATSVVELVRTKPIPSMIEVINGTPVPGCATASRCLLGQTLAGGEPKKAAKGASERACSANRYGRGQSGGRQAVREDLADVAAAAETTKIAAFRSSRSHGALGGPNHIVSRHARGARALVDEPRRPSTDAVAHTSATSMSSACPAN
jgi:hypothetical protein